MSDVEQQKQEENDPKQEETTFGWHLTMLNCLLGSLFGFALQKGAVYLPVVIVDQLLLKDFTMMKMFLSAAAVSAIALTVLSLYSRSTFDDSIRDGKDKTLVQVGFGSTLLGIGMALSGSCPGTVLAQIGSGISAALVTFGFGLLGAFSYGLAVKFGFDDWFGEKRPKRFVDQLIGIPFWIAALILAVALIGCVFLFEVLFPFEGNNDPTGNVFVLERWHPAVSGVIVGTVQLLSVFLLSRTVGCSSGYVAIAAQPCRIVPGALEAIPYMEKQSSGPKAWSHVFFLLGAIMGAALASLSAQTFEFRTGTSDNLGGLSLITSAIGGFCIVFGARCANGCTSGNGLSGLAKLSLASFVATTGMFGGGIVAAFIIRAAGGYPSFVE